MSAITQLTSTFDTIGGIKFTLREIEVLSCIIHGRSTKKIAAILSLSPKTVENYNFNIRAKLSCNSRESIRDFLDKSDQANALRQYYYFLIFRSEVDKRLKEFSSRNAEPTSIKIIHWNIEEPNGESYTQVKNVLELAGLKPAVQLSKAPSDLATILNEVTEVPTLFILPQELKKNVDTIKAKELNNPDDFLVIYKNGHFQEDLSLPRSSHLDLDKTIRFYTAMSQIFQQLNPNSGLDDLLLKLQESIRTGGNTIEFGREDVRQKKDTWITTIGKRGRISLVCFVGFLFISLGLAFTWYQNTAPENTIRSDLLIPVQDALLERPELMKQLQEKFKGQKGIHTIALIGPGGAGKTTLARMFAHVQKNNIIWEINAETPESLRNSFEALASALAKNQQEKEVLQEIQSIRSLREKEKKVLGFVKEHLKLTPNWLLIFDNVETFADIQNYFPHDVETWGPGKVLITTRDKNVQNNKFVNSSLHIGELSAQQKVAFFLKIINQGKDHDPKIAQNHEVINFLSNIPSYPLDVSVAAYYLKSTHIPFEAYLDSLNSYHNEFLKVQEQLLKENGEYLKTRYSIVSLSIKKLIETRPEFAELLLLISMIDSQNIPVDLLKAHINSFIVDDFIFRLKKYSLITNENNLEADQISTVSIHRSTQSIALAHLQKKLSSEKMQASTTKTSKALKNFAEKASDQQNHTLIKLLQSHYEKFESHQALLSKSVHNSMKWILAPLYQQIGDSSKTKICLKNAGLDEAYRKGDIAIVRPLMFLGYALRELGDYQNSKASLEKSLVLCKQRAGLEKELGSTLVYLGNTYRDLGNYAKAIELLTQALTLLKKDLPRANTHYAEALTYMGVAYWFSTDYVKAKEYLEECYRLHQQNNNENPLMIGWSGSHLGNIYGELGYPEKAEELLTKSLKILWPVKTSNERGYCSLLLGNLYRKLKDYEKAKAHIEEGYKILKQIHPDNKIRLAEATHYLGILKGEMGEYESALDNLNQSLSVYETYYGNQHVQYGRVLGNIGKVYLFQRNLAKAEPLLQISLEILIATNSSDAYLVSEALADLYDQKAELETGQKAEEHKKKSKDYLMRAHQCLIDHFPKDSVYLKKYSSTGI